MAHLGFSLRSQEFVTADIEIKADTVSFQFRIDRGYQSLPDFSSSINYLKMGPAGRGQAVFYSHDNSFGFSYSCFLDNSDSLISLLKNTLPPISPEQDRVIDWVKYELKFAKQNNPLKGVLVSQSMVAQPRKQSGEVVGTPSATKQLSKL